MTFDEAVKDPDFLTLPPEEKQKVLASIDQDYASLSSGEQLKVIQQMGASGGMAAVKTNVGTIRDAVVPTPASVTAQQIGNIIPAPGLSRFLSAAFPPDVHQAPAAAFKQDVSTGNAQDTSLNDAMIVQGIATAPQALRSAGALVDAGSAKALSYLKTLRGAKGAAESLASMESPLTAGLDSKAAFDANNKAMAETVRQTYADVPKDLIPATSNAKRAAAEVMAEHGTLSPSFQSKKIMSMAKDISKMDEAPIRSIQLMQSQLKDMAINGEGVEKAYAYKLSKALQADLEEAAKIVTPPVSQELTLEAGQLRNMWGNMAREQSGASPEMVGAYTKPELFQSQVPQAVFTKADAAAKLRKANAFYSDVMDLKDHPVAKALERARPEELPDVIFKRGNVDDVRVAKSLLDQTGYQKAQGQFYNELLASKNVGKELSKYSPDFLKESLGAKKLKALQDLAHFNDVVTKAIKAGKGALLAGGIGELYRRLGLRH